MESIDIEVLAQNLSHDVGKAASGNRVAVPVGGELVVYLVPAVETSVLTRLAATGRLRPSTENIRDVLPDPTPPPGGKPVSETVLEMRDEERS
jgi:antitoxin (DNA-binding transcriptional repressor) of toxin-antitoxin stability system